MNNQPFLWQVAKALREKFGERLYRVAIVFPNRRQSVYFREYLKLNLTAPALLPELLTVEELVIRSSDYALADPVRQSISLYQAYLNTHKETGNIEPPMSFEDFYGLSQVLLADMEETDAYGVHAEKIFSLIADYKEIDARFEELTEEQRTFLKSFWASINLQDSYQQKFAELWRLIPKWYAGLHELLMKDGYATLGLMQRQLAVSGTTLPDNGWEHIAFVGFNAFTGAQEKFIQHWYRAGLASLWLDVDAYYFDNPLHEAGYFFRRNFQKLGLSTEIAVGAYIPKSNANAANEALAMEVIQVNGQAAQAKVVAEWLKGLPDDLAPGKAAILLADEKLLLPVLQSLPKEAPTINITMGYPVAQSPLYSLLNLFFDAQQAVEGKKTGSGFVPWEVAMQWLNHPLNDWLPGEAAKLKEKLIKNGIQWVKIDTLIKQGKISKWLFTPFINHQNVFTWMRNLIQEVAQSPVTNGDNLLQGLLSGVFDNLVSMEPLYKDMQQGTSISFLKSVVMSPLASVSIPFEAESTAGIQIMGLLESRGLDFEYILLLGAGEGSLPRVAAAKTFIPYNLRKAFGLSTLEHQDAIFAYVFYRLLHRSKQIKAVYNGLVTDNSTGEVSRFIKQLEYESAIKIVHSVWQLAIKATATNEITIEKSEPVLNALRKYYAIEKPVPFSPSAINKYLSCRLQFFFSYIAGIKPPDEMQTEIDAAVFGSAVHGLLQTLYEKWMALHPGDVITEAAIETMIAWIPEHIDAEIYKALYGKEPTETLAPLKGFEAVVSDVVAHFTKGFLEVDRGHVPFLVHHNEMKFEHNIILQTVDGKREVAIGGKIDRVDEKDGVVRMVDFKTGGDKIDFEGLDALWTVHGEKQNKGALQTLLYALMFSKNHPEFPLFEPALIVLRGLKKDSNSKVRLYDKSTKTEVSAEVIQQYLPEVEAGVSNVIAEIFDREIPFDQTEDLKVCSYCDYKGICNR
jgi:ATP-dependent helicase/nuclease subunit B